MKVKRINSYKEGVSAVVLAAGKGRRMKSDLPKVLHQIKGKPIIYYVLKELTAVKKVKQIIVVLGHQSSQVREAVLSDFKGVEFVLQTELSGTASAVKSAQKRICYNKVIVACGDAPLVKSKTFSAMVSGFKSRKSKARVLTACIDSKNELGVIIRDDKNAVCRISERAVLAGKTVNNEVNSGVYFFDTATLVDCLSRISVNSVTKEYFLTDVIEIFYNHGASIESLKIKDYRQILGINDRIDLSAGEKIMQLRINQSFMEKGVTIIDPQTTFIEEGAKIGVNSIIYPFTFIEKGVIIGRNCSLGPFIHVRVGTKIKDFAQLGNFLEISRSIIGNGVKAKHFSYLGDAEIEENVNIGAGTVIANFDGKNKNKTVIEKNAFIGSNTVLVAPLKVCQGAMTGAGSVVTKDVNAGEVVLGVPARVYKRVKTSG